MPISKAGIAITSLKAWKERAGPKSPDQWVKDRSAMEVARAWLEGGGKRLPSEVYNALAGNQSFGPVKDWKAEPEAKLRFDNFAGEPRNSDLVVFAQDLHGSYLMAVEAKADEPFGETVAKTLAAAQIRLKENDRSKGVIRIEHLIKALLGPQQAGETPDDEIRYQLLTASAGTLCEAERHGYCRALMLVQEFVTDKTDDRKHERNAKDLSGFVGRLSRGKVNTVESGKIYGPFSVPGLPILENKVDLFIGKVTRNLRKASG